MRTRTLAIMVAALWTAGSSANAAPSCIRTYDRSGAVVGRYCAEGLVEPGDTPVGEQGETAPPSRSGTSAQTGQRTAPPGSEIRCDGRNGRCRGTFFIR
jgi:hypothetical protein